MSKRLKKEDRKTLYDLHHYAVYKYAKHSAQKMRLVANQIRGLSVPDAQKILKFSDRRAAVMITKCLDSALSNAAVGCAKTEKKPATDPKSLSILYIWVDEAPTRKGWIPRSKGMANPLLFRSSHITVLVGEKEEA